MWLANKGCHQNPDCPTVPLWAGQSHFGRPWWGHNLSRFRRKLVLITVHAQQPHTPSQMCALVIIIMSLVRQASLCKSAAGSQPFKRSGKNFFRFFRRVWNQTMQWCMYACTLMPTSEWVMASKGLYSKWIQSQAWQIFILVHTMYMINPRCACARVTVVYNTVCVCLLHLFCLLACLGVQ